MMRLYERFVLGNEKAIVGFVVSCVLSGLAVFHITGDMRVEDALTLVVMAAVTGVSVWFKKNSSGSDV